MAKISIEEIKEMLNGCEVQSISQEGVVGFSKGNFYMDSDILDLSEKEIQKLWKEYLKNELN